MVRRALMAGLLALAAAACSPPRPFLAGEERIGPLGWYEYCHRHPEDGGCAVATAQEQQDATSPGLVSGR